MQRLEFRAMNSDIELVCCASDAERRLQTAERWLAAFEARYSRFQPLSELSRLNAAAGRPFRASRGLFKLVALSLRLAEGSGGLFDPTVLPDLIAAGYDRSFELLRPAAKRAAGRRRFSWRDVTTDAATRTILLPEGAAIDLGGIGKGWAVDRLPAMLGSPCLVNGGGDVYAAGRPPDEADWRIGVSDPFQPERDIAVLSVTDRGVATSSSLRRNWRQDGVVQHHLIDPRTGRPSHSDAVQVTVMAQTTLLADFHAKVALLLGTERGLSYLESLGDVQGLIVADSGSLAATSGLSRFFTPA